MLENDSEPAVAPRLRLWDAISIIIGIVVGTTIFRSTASVFANSGSAGSAMLLWALGGLLAWCGAVCYAELATTYPRDGGDYVYLSRAYGSWCGFLFGWTQLTAIISGNIAIMAYAFADYTSRLYPAVAPYAIYATIVPVVLLSFVNAAGIAAGKSAQNILTVAKVIGIAALIVVGFLLGTNQPATSSAPASSNTNIGLALVFVLYAYGGWSHAAYVAAEVREQKRNLPRALFLGIAAITVIYLLVNAAYLATLGYDAASKTPTPAADVMELVLGPWGGRVISLLVMISALSAINGMILTSSRVYAVWGADYPALHWLGEWNSRTGAPFVAIAVQAVVAVFLIVAVGTSMGRSAFDSLLAVFGIDGLPWDRYFGGFETLVAASAPTYWAFCLLTTLSVFVLRYRDPNIERPFRVPLLMLPAVVFGAACIYMLISSIQYAAWLTVLGVAPLVAGMLLWFAITFFGKEQSWKSNF